MKLILYLYFLFYVSISGCSACSGKGHGDATDKDAADTGDLEITEGEETGLAEDPDMVNDAPDDMTHERDDFVAEIEEPDSVDDSCGSGYVEDRVGHLEPVPFTPSRAPTECGEGCRQVSFANEGIWRRYSVWGNHLVFDTTRGGSEDGVTTKLFLVDLTNLEHYIIGEAFSLGDCRPSIVGASIHENSIIYSYDIRNIPAEVQYAYMIKFNLSTSVADLIWNMTYPLGGHPSTHTIFKNHIIFMDNRTGEFADTHYYLFDMITREEKEISTGPCFVCGYYIYDNYVVFLGYGGGGYVQVFLHDIEAGETRGITSGNWDHVGPSVYGETVVWTDMRNGGDYLSLERSDIYMKNLATGEETAVCDHPASVGYGHIWGNKIAWTDCRNDPEYPNVPSRATVVDIYMYDIETGEETQFTSNPGRKSGVRIHGNKLYFLMNDDSGIYSVFEKEIGIGDP